MLAALMVDLSRCGRPATPCAALDAVAGGLRTRRRDSTCSASRGGWSGVPQSSSTTRSPSARRAARSAFAARRTGDASASRSRIAGPGIPEDKLKAIFDRFYTERPKGEKFGTHSGLGLSISKQIVEAHRGAIRAENRYDAENRLRRRAFHGRFARRFRRRRSLLRAARAEQNCFEASPRYCGC